jgi:hypothetical protein
MNPNFGKYFGVKPPRNTYIYIDKRAFEAILTSLGMTYLMEGGLDHGQSLLNAPKAKKALRLLPQSPFLAFFR